MVSVRERRSPRMGACDGCVLAGSMRLHMVPGRRSRGKAAAAASLSSGGAMDPEVWRNLPDDILWKVLAMVPAAKRFQLHLVSREWRRVLTSSQFRKTVAARDATFLVVAYVIRGSGSLSVGLAAGTSTSGGGGARTSWYVDVDLSFVPSRFWRRPESNNKWYSLSAHHGVVAAGDGLVCLLDGPGKQLCVLNPATRTCKVVGTPPVVWERSTAVIVRIHAGALVVLAGTWNWAVAWCDLLDGGGAGRWAVALGPQSGQPTARLADWPHDPADGMHRRLLHLVVCGGEWYCYKRGKVYVHAVVPIPASASASAEGAAAAAATGAGDAPDPGQLVATAEVAAPCHAVWDDVALVAHSGRIFFTSLVDESRAAAVCTKQTKLKLCGVWVLDRHRMEWHEVGEALHTPGLERLRGIKYTGTYHPGAMAVCGAYGSGDLVCLDILLVQDRDRPWVRTVEIEKVRVTVGLNLVTRAWELVHDSGRLIARDGRLEFAHAFQFRPDLFLS